MYGEQGRRSGESARLPPMCPIPGPGVICGLNLLLVLYSAPRGFSPGTPVFPSPQKSTFPNSNSILECTDIFERVLELLGVPWVNKLLHFTSISFKRTTLPQNFRNWKPTLVKLSRLAKSRPHEFRVEVVRPFFEEASDEVARGRLVLRPAGTE